MGSRSVRLFHEHVLVKEPDSDVPTPWHHDQPYYSVDGAQTCSLWIPLNSVPRDTVPEFVAGSHLWGKWFRPDRFNKSPLNADDGLEPVPDVEGQPRSIPHPRLAHGAGRRRRLQLPHAPRRPRQPPGRQPPPRLLSCALSATTPAGPSARA